MLLIPSQLVVALFLLLFFVRLVVDDKPWTAARITFSSVILLFSFHSFVNAMVWTYGITWMRPILPIDASILPLITWYAFFLLTSKNNSQSLLLLLLLVPPLIIMICVFAFPPAVDIMLVLQFIAYGIALLHLAAAGPDVFQESILSKSTTAMRAAQLTGILLIINALIDTSITIDFQITGGEHFYGILSIVSILILLFLGVATFAAIGAGRIDDDDEGATVSTVMTSSNNDKEIVSRVEEFLHQSRLYTNPDLSLSMLARKLGMQPRQISSAINRYNGTNVSQYINQFRLNEACRLLRSTEDSITNIHYDSGFLTKSNFNREFKRQFGCSPTEWRNAETEAAHCGI